MKSWSEVLTSRMNCPSLALVCNPVSGRALSNMQMAPSSVGSALLPFFIFKNVSDFALSQAQDPALLRPPIRKTRPSQRLPGWVLTTNIYTSPVHPTPISTSLFLFLDFNRVALGRFDGLSSHCWCPYVTKNGGKSCLCVCRTSVCRWGRPVHRAWRRSILWRGSWPTRTFTTAPASAVHTATPISGEATADRVRRYTHANIYKGFYCI